MHLHLRDGQMMEYVVPYSASVFGKCIIMPNTVPPITSVEMASLLNPKKVLIDISQGGGLQEADRGDYRRRISYF